MEIQPIFYAMRHGETAANDKNTYRAWSNRPDAQLSPAGRDGIRESAIFLKQMNQPISVILCDDLDRTQETARICADILGVKEIQTVPGLKPLNMGDYTGKSKLDHPVEPYMKDKNKVIPGGESVHQFDVRQIKLFGDILDVIIEHKILPLIIMHGSNVSFLYNHATKGVGEIGYEGLVLPSGLLVFTKDGIIPLTKKKNPVRSPYADGTALSGFVTDKENRPPRECWNCRNFHRDMIGLGSCDHLLVRIDPEIKSRRQTDGTVAVGDQDCCNNFRNKINT